MQLLYFILYIRLVGSLCIEEPVTETSHVVKGWFEICKHKTEAASQQRESWFTEHPRANKGLGVTPGDGFTPQLSAAITALFHSSTFTPTDKLDAALLSSQCHPKRWQKPITKVQGLQPEVRSTSGGCLIFSWCDGEVRACVLLPKQ